jgi:tetratricopeptide (TPR) repeat protein
MHLELALNDDEAASEIYASTLNLIETDDPSIETPPESRRIILSWARRLYEKGEYVQAADAYSRVSMPEFPAADVAWALYQQGNCYYHMAEFERAGESYARLTAEFANSEWVRYARAKEELMSVGAGI